MSIALKQLADADGLSRDELIQRLVRSERQRRIGTALAEAPPDAEDRRLLDAGRIPPVGWPSD